MTNENGPWEELTKRVDICSKDIVGLAVQVREMKDEQEHLHQLIDIAKDGFRRFNARLDELEPRLAELEQRFTQSTWAKRNESAEMQTYNTRIDALRGVIESVRDRVNLLEERICKNT